MKRHYSSPTPGHPRRFQKMPRTEKPQPRESLPKLPSTEAEALHHLRNALVWHSVNWPLLRECESQALFEAAKRWHAAANELHNATRLRLDHLNGCHH